MVKKIWHRSSLKQVNGMYIFEKLLPKGLFACDYSAQDNLIEMEDTTAGDRFWVDPKHVFGHPCNPNNGLEFNIGLEILVWDWNGENAADSTAITATLKKFDARIFRKRCYAQVVFEPIPNSERPFNFPEEAIAGVNV